MVGVLLVPILDAVAQEGAWGAAWGHRSCREHYFAIWVALALASPDEIFSHIAGAHIMASAPAEAAEAVGRACACNDCCELVFDCLCDLLCKAGYECDHFD